MAEFFTFTPSANSAFQFQPTLDGQTYLATVAWNLFGKRWYLNITTTDGALILSRALVGSPSGYNVQSMSWANGRVYVQTESPHVYPFMDTVNLLIANTQPIAYNGYKQCYITGPDTFEFNMSDDPGQVLIFGQVSYDINLVEDYFSETSMVFRQQQSVFEVRP